MIEATLKELSVQLANKDVSAVELATAYLARIDALNPTLNALVTLPLDDIKYNGKKE